MIDKLYMFSDLNRDSGHYKLDDVFSTWVQSNDVKLISMGEDEQDYLFAMQLMFGSQAKIIPFQQLHDDYWCDSNYKKQPLREFLRGFFFSTDPSFLDYMMDNQGDLKWQRKVKERGHWSQADRQIFLNGPFPL